jgi:hypothetical protein
MEESAPRRPPRPDSRRIEQGSRWASGGRTQSGHESPRSGASAERPSIFEDSFATTYSPSTSQKKYARLPRACPQNSSGSLCRNVELSRPDIPGEGSSQASALDPLSSFAGRVGSIRLFFALFSGHVSSALLQSHRNQFQPQRISCQEKRDSHKVWDSRSLLNGHRRRTRQSRRTRPRSD